MFRRKVIVQNKKDNFSGVVWVTGCCLAFCVFCWIAHLLWYLLILVIGMGIGGTLTFATYRRHVGPRIEYRKLDE